MKARTLWYGTLILLVAAALRMVALGEVPPGLYHDEAYYGLDAVDVLHGRLALYFPANNGREPLFIYLVALAIAVLGKSPFALRLVSSFAGLLTVAVTAAAGRVLFSRRVGLLAAAVLAVMLWHVHLSRVGFRAVTLPLLLALTLWQAALGSRKAGERRSKWWQHWVMAGVLYGLTFYTYTAARFTPVALVVFGLYAWALKPQTPHTQYAPRLCLALLTALLTVAPLAAYTVLHPDVVLGRPEQVSIFSPAINNGDVWGALVRSTRHTLGMFFVRGDRIWRHNVPWRPVFDPLLGAAFVLGLAVALRRARRELACGLVVIWTVVMALPTLLAEDAPHFLRAAGMLPVVALLPALGMECVFCMTCCVRRVESRQSSLLSNCPLLIVSLFVVFALASTVRAYFGEYARHPMTGYWFERGALVLGQRVAEQQSAGARVYIDPVLWDEWPQIRFLAQHPEALIIGLEPPAYDLQSLTPNPPSPVAVFVWPYGNWQRAWALLPTPAEVFVEKGPLSQGDRDPAPYTTFVAFLAVPSDRTTPARASLSSGIEWLGAEVLPLDGGVRVRLRWRATARLRDDYTIFLHYLRDGERIAQADSRPASGFYPTTCWHPGDVINDDHFVADVSAPQPGRDALLFGFWQPESGARLYVLDEAGNPAGDWIEVAVE
ncbi:MAG: glycosyltransferase family 39 protein [Anaerolineae bacterium]|nr:glycosyltransferase family 39 protein [Anaerolineae bacterium]